MTGSTESSPIRARVGSVGVYATPAELHAYRRSRVERATRAAFTLAGCWLVAPLAFLIPPYLEPGLIAMLAGLYFARRAWVGEWVADRLSASCPRCAAGTALKPGSVLFLPHTVRCATCGAECWLELQPAVEVDDAVRQAAVERARLQGGGSGGAGELGGRPPKTWSPASSDWRDR